VLVNAVFIVQQRIEKMSRPTLIDDQNLFGVATGEFTDRLDYDATLHEDLAYLRSLPGVVSASATNSVPLGISGSGQSVWTQPHTKGNRTQINYFSMDEQGLKTLGVRLIAGRGFRANEILPPVTPTNSGDFVPQLILTQAAAEALFPHQNALGKTAWGPRHCLQCARRSTAPRTPRPPSARTAPGHCDPDDSAGHGVDQLGRPDRV
jgi:putative ABC transport system permease protein